MSLSVSVGDIVEKSNNPLLTIKHTWQRIALEEICNVLNGYAFKSNFFNSEKKGMPLIRIRDVQESTVETYYFGDYPKEYLISEGDILVGMDGDFNCKKWGNIPALLNQRVCKIEVVSKNYVRDFLYYILPPYLNEINAWTSAVTVKHLSSFSIKEIPLPLPPLNEQKRIVAKLDKIIPRVDSVKARLYRIPGIIKRFRQSVLSAAVTGRLTEKWREAHPEVESVDTALCIISEKNSNSYLNVFEETQEYDLPLTWIYAPLENLGVIQGGGTPSKSNPSFWKGDIPWISPKDMKVDKISKGVDFISKEAIKNSSVKLLPRNTILFVVRGMILIHTFPVALTQNEVTINQDMKGITPFQNINPEYLFCVLKSLQGKILSYIKEATHGTLRLEMPLIQTIAIPLPPLPEQQEIVRQVNRLFSLADKLDLHYQKAKARVDKLSQSVLAKAFRGELVPQDPNDEPAEKLLERIMEEKKKLTPGTPRIRGKNK